MEESVTQPDAWTRRLASGWIYWPVCLAGTALLGLAVLGPEAERRLAMETQCAAMEAEVDALARTRNQLAAAQRALQNDPDYTERVVRHELNVTRPGETRMPMPTARVADPPEPAPPAPSAALPLLADVARWADARRQFLALVSGSALVAVGLVLSLPGRATQPHKA